MINLRLLWRKIRQLLLESLKPIHFAGIRSWPSVGIHAARVETGHVSFVRGNKRRRFAGTDVSQIVDLVMANQY